MRQTAGKNRGIVDPAIREQALDASNLTRRVEHENVAGVDANGVNDGGDNGTLD